MEKPVEAETEAAFRTVWDHLVVEDEPGLCDAILCFGSRHWRVPHRTAALHRGGIAPTVVVTGGTLEADGRREADRIASELVELGVPQAALCLERSARNTSQNVLLGMSAFEARDRLAGTRFPPERLALVSWPLAARRCRATFARHFPTVEVVSVPALATPGRRWSPTAKRMRLALGELDRLDRYGQAGHIVAVPCPSQVRGAAEVLRRFLAAAASPTPTGAVAPAPCEATLSSAQRITRRETGS